MEPSRLEQALWVEKKAARCFAEKAHANEKGALRTCEHIDDPLLRSSSWAYFQCMLLASSIDRGRASGGIMLEVCAEAPDGPIWDPPSVVYWTTKASGRYPDREATVLLLELWDLRRRLGSARMGPSQKLMRSERLGEGGAVKYRRSHPLIDVEHAVAWAMPDDLNVVNASKTLERMRNMLSNPKAFDWSTDGMALLPDWAAVAPVVPKRVSQDARTVTAQRWIDMLMARNQDDQHMLLEGIRRRDVVIRELQRMPISPWLRQGLVEAANAGA